MAFEEELSTAITLARSAGSLISRIYDDDETIAVSYKGGKEPLTKADKESNEHIVSRVLQKFPDDAVLAEESSDNLNRLTKSRVWIIDPLDGTKEFIARNGEFAVMIGLVVDGRPVVGAVYLPARDWLYYAADGQGSFCERGGKVTRLRTSEVQDPRQARIVMSRSHLKENERDMIDRLSPAERITSGSVGVKLGMIAEQKADIYLTMTRQGIKEWDTCAPEIILREAGGVITSMKGDPLRYNKEIVQQQDGMLACATPALLRNVLAHAAI